jgi:hypothetical protein
MQDVPADTRYKQGATQYFAATHITFVIKSQVCGFDSA